MGGTMLSILMLSGLGLLAGAWALWRRGNDRRKVILMIVAALVMFANVAIWTIPTESGQSPAELAEPE